MIDQLRQQVVEQFVKMDLECEQELQQTVRLAAKLFNCPFASISVLDDKIIWLKVKVGLDVAQAPRHLSLCTHTLKKKTALIIPDTLQDARFVNHPSVCNVPHVRFYAGVPLITRSGHKIGTLCVFDSKPHTITPDQELMLKLLARHAVSIMELLLSLTELNDTVSKLKEERLVREQNDFRLRAMFESMKDVYLLLGKQGELLDYNKAAYSFVKTYHGSKLRRGQQLDKYLSPAFRHLFTGHRLAALAGERTHLERMDDYGELGKTWWLCIFEPIRNENKEVIGTSYIQRNISERKAQEERILEQNALLIRLAEIQAHDYRGPVASIIGMMNLIEEEGYVASKEYLLMLQAAVNKLDEKIHEAVGLVNNPQLALYPN